MNAFFRIIFSPVIILWWLVKLVIQILFIPVRILWAILRMVLPELTRPLEGVANGLSQIFRLS